MTSRYPLTTTAQQNRSAMAPKPIKLKMVLMGPSSSGKTSIANFLSDVTENVTGDVRKTRGVRIVDFQIEDLTVNDNPRVAVDVELWDTSGDRRYEQYWPVFLHEADAIIYVCSSSDQKKDLESMHSYCSEKSDHFNGNSILFVHEIDNEDKTELKTIKSYLPKVQNIVVNVQENGEELRKRFNEFVAKVAADKV